jgi:serine/threonine protein kinase
MGTFQEITGALLPDTYSLIRSLGQGPISHVFLARNTHLKRLVALKVLRSSLADDPVSQKRFVREAQAAARINHPAVVSIYAVGRLENDLPYIEMQHIDGRNLGDTLEGHGQFDVPEARRILAQLASALNAAHEQHVIHRALEPSNVLLGRDGDSVYLTDFGVAGILETGTETVTKLTRAGELLGSPAYMSPEQLRGEPLTVESDIYSFGLLGYEILTFQGPFGDSDVSDIVGAHIRRPPIELHVVHTDIPKDLSDILKRCLAKKPQNRPTAKDLVDFFSAASGKTPDVAGNSDTPLQGAIAGFIGELQDRKVYRAAAAYAALVFVILQVADLVFPPLDVSDWIYRLLVILSVSAFPFVVALAWLFDWREGRLTRTEDVDRSFTGRASPRQQIVLQVFGMGVSVIVSIAIAWWLLGGS